MRNKIALVGLGLSLIALVVFLNYKKNTITSVETQENQAHQEKPLGRAQANAEPSSQSQVPDVSERDFFFGDVRFADIKSRAESGDAIAQRQLSEIYEDCLFFSLNPEKHFGGLDQLSDMKPESKPYLQKIKVRMRAFCSTVDNGQAIALEAHELWRERSAESGDLTSKIRISSLADKPLSATELQSIFENVSQTGDPKAMFEFGSLAASNKEWAGQKGNEALYGQYSEYAWQIAACRHGLNCSSESRIMRNVCTGMMLCQYRNFEDFVYAEIIPAGARKDIERRVHIIRTDFVQARNN